jgi:hypothetical protein
MPGTGIGGLFYLLSALLMPLRELWRVVASGGTYRPDVRAWHQFGMAAGIAFVAYLTGESLVWAGIIDPSIEASRFVRPSALAFALLTLVFVGVELMAAALRYARERQDLSPIAPSNDGGAGR